MIRGSEILVVAKRTRKASGTLFRGPFFLPHATSVFVALSSGLGRGLRPSRHPAKPCQLTRFGLATKTYSLPSRARNLSTKLGNSSSRKALKPVACWSETASLMAPFANVALPTTFPDGDRSSISL